jgi:hypothetical protein
MASMKYLVLALPFLAVSGAAWADEVCLPPRMSLDDERRAERREPQDVEMDRQRPDDSARLTPMEFVYRHSQLEAGMMYTDFDNSLGLKSHLGYYVRCGVEIAPHLSVNMTYRYNTFGNGPASTVTPEDVRVQALLFGASYHYPLSPEFAVVGGVGIGPSWWDSTVVPNDLGFTISGELGVTARLWEVLRLKTGLVFDGANTSFHKASGLSVNLSWLVGFELGL